MNENVNPRADFTIADPAFIKCPFADYEWMRDQHPVFRDQATGFFVVTRYEDVRKIVMTPSDWSNKAAVIINRKSEIADEIAGMYSADGWLPMDTLVTNDPPDHKRYRGLVDRAFSQARVQTIQPLIDATVERLLDAVVGKGAVDFMRTVAVPLTMTVIANQLGVDPADTGLFRRWTDSLMEAINPLLTPERERAITRDVIQLQHYLARAIERYRHTRGETILSDLVYAELDGEMLTVREIIAVATLLLGAGNDTTTSTLCSAARHLAEHPEVFLILRNEPEKVPTFIEESLRLYAPVQRLFRRARRDLQINGVPIPEGSVVVIQWGGANRDSRRFERPNDLDLDRADAHRHLSFGAGIHFCIGNQLARAELRTAVTRLAQRAGAIRLARGAQSFDYHPQLINLSPSRMEVIIEAPLRTGPT